MCSSETKPHPTRPILIFAIADCLRAAVAEDPLYSKSGPGTLDTAHCLAEIFVLGRDGPRGNLRARPGLSLRRWNSATSGTIPLGAARCNARAVLNPFRGDNAAGVCPP